MKDKIPNIIIVDDHELFRDGIKTMFELSGIANVVAEASNGMEFLDLLNHTIPDIVLMDIDMPVMNGIAATKEAIIQYPNIKILALSMFSDQKYYQQMIKAGACGFVLKTSNKTELEKAIIEVNLGHGYFSTELLQEMITNWQPAANFKRKDSIPSFSDKEVEIMKLMCLGLSIEEIGTKVFLSPKTVANYKNIMLNKTGCKNSTNLIFYAIQNKIINI